MMNVLDFGELDQIPTHQCDSYRKGDWIVFKCPQCHDYERKVNWKTGEVRVKNSTEVLHSGKYLPHNLEYACTN